MSDRESESGCFFLFLVVVLLFAGGNWVYQETLGTGHAVEGDDAVKNIDRAVADKHEDAPWFDRIDEVSSGYLADMKIQTDLEASSPSDMQLAIQLCEAYAAEFKTKPYLLVYGHSTQRKEKIDGSFENDVFEHAKLARANDDRTCEEAGILR